MKSPDKHSKQGPTLIDTMKREAQARCEAILEEARQEAARLVAEARQTVEEKRDKALEEERKRDELMEVREKKLAEKLAEKLGKVSVTATVTVGEDDRIFGTITSQNVADLLKEKGFEIDKKQISIEEQIKALGIYPVKVRLEHGVETSIKLWVVKDTNETS